MHWCGLILMFLSIKKIKLHTKVYEIRISDNGIKRVQFEGILDAMNTVLTKSTYKMQGDFEGMKIILHLVGTYPIQQESMDFLVTSWNDVTVKLGQRKQKMKVL